MNQFHIYQLDKFSLRLQIWTKVNKKMKPITQHLKILFLQKKVINILKKVSKSGKKWKIYNIFVPIFL